MHTLRSAVKILELEKMKHECLHVSSAQFMPVQPRFAFVIANTFSKKLCMFSNFFCIFQFILGLPSSGSWDVTVTQVPTFASLTFSHECPFGSLVTIRWGQETLVTVKGWALGV